MDIELTPDQIDKLLSSYFNVFFKDAYLAKKNLRDSGKWTGFWKDFTDGTTDLLIGYPSYEYGNTWYSNGQILDGWKYLNIHPKDFYDSLIRYILKTFGRKIETIT